MKAQSLKAENRTLTGRKVKKLRIQGLTPATVYGKNIKSTSIAVGTEDFQKVFEMTGETGLIDLKLDNSNRPVLVHTVQLHAVSGVPLHIEFHQVDLKEKVNADIPLVVENTAPAVEQKLGLLLQVLNEIEVEALPTDLPDQIVVDVSKLSAVGDELTVSNLSVPKSVSVLTEKSLTVVRIAPLAAEEPTEVKAAPETAEDTAEAVSEEGAPEKEPSAGTDVPEKTSDE